MRAISYFAWAATLALCAGLLMGQVTRQGRTDPKLRQFKKPFTGAGMPPAELSTESAPAAWSSMGLDAKNEVLSAYGLHVTVNTDDFKLTPRHPVEGGRAHLVFAEVRRFDSADDALQLHSKGSATVVFTPLATGKPHLIVFSFRTGLETGEVNLICGVNTLTTAVKKYSEYQLPIVVTPSTSPVYVTLTTPSNGPRIWFHEVSVQLVK
jgi:hypothetical protein